MAQPKTSETRRRVEQADLLQPASLRPAAGSANTLPPSGYRSAAEPAKAGDTRPACEMFAESLGILLVFPGERGGEYLVPWANVKHAKLAKSE